MIRCLASDSYSHNKTSIRFKQTLQTGGRSFGLRSAGLKAKELRDTIDLQAHRYFQIILFRGLMLAALLSCFRKARDSGRARNHFANHADRAARGKGGQIPAVSAPESAAGLKKSLRRFSWGVKALHDVAQRNVT
jgi:hypothetical protein